MNNISLVRQNGERYLFLYDNSARSRDALLAKLDEFANDSELSFTSKEAEVLGQRLRLLAQQQPETPDE